MCLTAKHFGLQEENTSPNSREIPLISQTGWGTTEREKEGVRMQCYEKGE